MSITPRARAGMYVDGFNLYHSIDDLGKPYLKWLSLARLAVRLSKPFDADMVEIIFCTAFFPGDFDKRKRHEAYLDALRAEGVTVMMGHTTQEDADCLRCDHRWKRPREKETDINVALSLFEAVSSDRIDLAFLVTADTDQAATLKFVKRCFPEKRTVVLTPPGRGTPAHLQAPLAWKSVRISETDLDLSVLPSMIKPEDGRLIIRPKEYQPPKGWLHPDERR